MRRILVLVALSVFCVTTNVFANLDLNPPAWRGDAGSTYGVWDFSTDSKTPDLVGSNPYGTTKTTVIPTPGQSWIPSLDGAVGVWPLSGQIIVEIPNRKIPGPEKWIQIQLVWKSEISGGTPNIWIIDNNCTSLYNIKPMPSYEQDVGAWKYSLYYIVWQGNPDAETINIGGNIFVDELIIDTICIPEPATLAVFGIGAAFLFVSRKRLTV